MTFVGVNSPNFWWINCPCGLSFTARLRRHGLSIPKTPVRNAMLWRQLRRTGAFFFNGVRLLCPTWIQLQMWSENSENLCWNGSLGLPSYSKELEAARSDEFPTTFFIFHHLIMEDPTFCCVSSWVLHLLWSRSLDLLKRTIKQFNNIQQLSPLEPPYSGEFPINRGNKKNSTTQQIMVKPTPP